MKKIAVTFSLLTMTFAIVLSSQAGLLENQSFEESLDNGWYVFDDRQGQEVTTSTDQALEGTQSLKFNTEVSDTRVNYDVVAASDNMPAVTPGDEYELQGNYYVPDSLQDEEALGVGLFWYKLDSNDDWVPSDDNPGDWTAIYGPDENHDTGQEVTGEWTSIADSDTAPSDAEYLQVGIQVMGRGSTAYFDDMEVVPEPMSLAMLLIAGGALLGFRRFFRHSCDATEQTE